MLGDIQRLLALNLSLDLLGFFEYFHLKCKTLGRVIFRKTEVEGSFLEVNEPEDIFVIMYFLPKLIL